MGCNASSSLRHQKLDEFEEPLPFNAERWIGEAFQLSMYTNATQMQWSALLRQLQKASRHDWVILDRSDIFPLVVRYISNLLSVRNNLDPVLSTWIVYFFTHLPNKSETRIWKLLSFVCPLWDSLWRSPREKLGKRLLNLMLMNHELFVRDCEDRFAFSLSTLLGEKVKKLWDSWPASADLRCVALIGLIQTTDLSTISFKTLTKRREQEKDPFTKSVMDTIIECVLDENL